MTLWNNRVQLARFIGTGGGGVGLGRGSGLALAWMMTGPYPYLLYYLTESSQEDGSSFQSIITFISNYRMVLFCFVLSNETSLIQHSYLTSILLLKGLLNACCFPSQPSAGSGTGNTAGQGPSFSCSHVRVVGQGTVHTKDILLLCLPHSPSSPNRVGDASLVDRIFPWPLSLPAQGWEHRTSDNPYRITLSHFYNARSSEYFEIDVLWLYQRFSHCETLVFLLTGCVLL